MEESIKTFALKKPVMNDGEELRELAFDFEKLTGRDSLEVELELSRRNISMADKAFNGMFLSRLAARACTAKIGADVMSRLDIRDYQKIERALRNFLIL